jgi:hypothetical protein
MKHVTLFVMFLVGAGGAVGCYDPGYGDGNGGPHHGGARCRELTTCGACTPVLGCGWCSSGSKGLCTDEPNDCANVSSFTWTWELDFCPAADDAGTVRDVGRTEPTSDDAGVNDGGD